MVTSRRKSTAGNVAAIFIAASIAFSEERWSRLMFARPVS